MPNLLSTLIHSAAARTASKRDSRLLVREFAAYSTPIDRDDLELFARRYPTDQAPHLREALGRQAARLY